MSVTQMLTSHVAGISELKKNPMAVVKSGTAEEGIVAILNRNKPVFYCISPEMLAYYQELAEDYELAQEAYKVMEKGGPFIEVTLNEL